MLCNIIYVTNICAISSHKHDLCSFYSNGKHDAYLYLVSHLKINNQANTSMIIKLIMDHLPQTYEQPKWSTTNFSTNSHIAFYSHHSILTQLKYSSFQIIMQLSLSCKNQQQNEKTFPCFGLKPFFWYNSPRSEIKARVS